MQTNLDKVTQARPEEAEQDVGPGRRRSTSRGWEAGKAGKWGNGAGWMGKQHAHDMRLRPGARTAAGHNEV